MLLKEKQFLIMSHEFCLIKKWIGLDTDTVIYLFWKQFDIQTVEHVLDSFQQRLLHIESVSKMFVSHLIMSWYSLF